MWLSQGDGDRTCRGCRRWGAWGVAVPPTSRRWAEWGTGTFSSAVCVRRPTASYFEKSYSVVVRENHVYQSWYCVDVDGLESYTIKMG